MRDTLLPDEAITLRTALPTMLSGCSPMKGRATMSLILAPTSVTIGCAGPFADLLETDVPEWTPLSLLPYQQEVGVQAHMLFWARGGLGS